MATMVKSGANNTLLHLELKTGSAHGLHHSIIAPLLSQIIINLKNYHHTYMIKHEVMNWQPTCMILNGPHDNRLLLVIIVPISSNVIQNQDFYYNVHPVQSLHYNSQAKRRLILSFFLDILENLYIFTVFVSVLVWSHHIFTTKASSS